MIYKTQNKHTINHFLQNFKPPISISVKRPEPHTNQTYGHATPGIVIIFYVISHFTFCTKIDSEIRIFLQHTSFGSQVNHHVAFLIKLSYIRELLRCYNQQDYTQY